MSALREDVPLLHLDNNVNNLRFFESRRGQTLGIIPLLSTSIRSMEEWTLENAHRTWPCVLISSQSQSPGALEPYSGLSGNVRFG